ncbi:MAG: hypothetical protein K2O11_03100 [Oscillospiraceae bacterium]|nr:hypothetical protein [Oscillospiraceae bacterium]
MEQKTCERETDDTDEIASPMLLPGLLWHESAPAHAAVIRSSAIQMRKCLWI